MIGAFGNIVFETSDQRIITLKDVGFKSQSRYANHDVIGQKPRQEYMGAGLNQLHFTIDLSRSHGVDVEEEIDKWRTVSEVGTVNPLILGDEMIGNLWIVKSLSEEWGTILKDGTIYRASLTINLEEYGGVIIAKSRSNRVKREGVTLKYPTPPSYESFTGVVSLKAVHIREGAGFSYDSVYTLSRGNLVNIIGQDNDWYKLEDGNYVNARGIN